MSALELWGGHECTVNRVGDRFFDQTVRSGHQTRLSDLELFADLGLKALRYPVLWERTSPERPDDFDWRWTDERLPAIMRLGVRPIAGLVHHGSGPKYTSLVDESFAPGLAVHARAVAERYPWIEDWTPVNEPLTTARFSCLYGLWYPHAYDEGACWRALLNEIDATRLAMAEVRKVNPNSRLIQTEDLGYVHARPGLEAQAEFENHRRWLTWDLLCGTVTPDHPLWERLCRFGLEDRLRAIADDPCPPDVIGVNHYLTSERLLDTRLEAYPPALHGGNGVQAYADLEAVRALADGPLGLEALLAETWDRYGRTIAVTESHLGCTREEQVRWVAEAWSSAERLRAEGVDLCAVTAWALLGSHDWNTLLTAERGFYEPGVFDVRSGTPRPTALAGLLKTLARGEAPKTLALSSPGWWRRDIRFVYEPVSEILTPAVLRRPVAPQTLAARPILITGATGTLGQAFARACDLRGLPYVLTDRRTLALDRPISVERALDELEPSAVINTAGWVRVDEAEEAEEACMAANAVGPENLARACERRGVPFVTFSSDLVFDGEAGRPYVEGDPTSPLNVYGRSKAEAEARVLATGADALIARTAAFFSPHDVHNFAVHTLATLSQNRVFRAANDCFVSPTYVPDLVDATLDLLIDGETGVWHLANRGRFSWAEFARTLAEAADLDPSLVEGATGADLGWAAPRPADVALSSERGQLLPAVESGVERFVHGWRKQAGGGRTRTICAAE
ncbi:MAG TPA: sugar nucleotide-binding protein [Caulobacteraceae bacterium]|nr:sugar nucleotide-binding protein [Caulobacteraceae bacterium]